MPSLPGTNIRGPQGPQGPAGADGTPGVQGPAGQDGAAGSDGADATINGVNALELEATGGIQGNQSGNKFMLDGSDLQSKGTTVTLTTSGWTSISGGFQQSVSVSGVTTSMTQIIWVDVNQSGTDLEADKALNDAWCAGPGQFKPKQQSGALQFFSLEKPTVNIPVDVVVTGT
jgi:hypothetical protein